MAKSTSLRPARERVVGAVRRSLFPKRARINDFERRTTSQFGEDGIIAELFRRIGTGGRFFVEFGVEDGSECNTAALAAAGWSGVLIEADPAAFARLAARYAASAQVRVAARFVNAENIAAVFAELGVPESFDLLSIDVDGNDYWLWKALGGYRPRAVVIEFNAEYPPPARWVMAYDPQHRWDRTTYYGASLASMAALAAQLGYALIGTTSEGVNAFFVRRAELSACGFPELSPEDAYHPSRFIGAAGTAGHPRGAGPAVHI